MTAARHLVCCALLAVAAAGAARDHRPAPPAGRLFVSPMGEPFRSDRDGDPEATWFAGADTDHDGRISLAEFQADARRWFDAIDRRHDGEIDPDDIDYYENVLVPEIRVADAPRGGGARSEGTGGSGRGAPPGGGMGRGGGMGGGMGGHRGGGRSGGDSGQNDGRTPVARATREGAARYGYLDLPEPLTAADANMNRGIDRTEMMQAAAQRFALLDRNGDGYLEKRELPRIDTRTNGTASRRGGDPRPPPPPGDHQLGGGDREEE